jgi:hypothetical protein
MAEKHLHFCHILCEIYIKGLDFQNKILELGETLIWDQVIKADKLHQYPIKVSLRL